MSQAGQTARFFRHWWPAVLAGAVAAIVLALAGLAWIVQAGAHDYARVAQQQYRGSEFEALVQAVQDEHRPLRDRNHAVWALGQFRETRALPILRRYYTGEECRHDRFLCQYELKKAIDLCSGQVSPPRFLQWMFPRVRG